MGRVMIGIDINLEFKPVKIAILTISDTRTVLTDTSGDILESKIKLSGHEIASRSIKRDTVDVVRDQISFWVNDPKVDVIITTGGTGLTGRDVTVEAISPMFDKVIDGFSVIFHQESFKSIGLSTLQSRACAGNRGRKLLAKLFRGIGTSGFNPHTVSNFLPVKRRLA